MSLEIRTIDPHDETALRAWWEVGHAATAERPGSPFPAWEVSRTALPADNPEMGTTLVGAYDGGSMVGAGLVMLPQSENLHTCWFDLYVVPSRRREGLGTLLLSDVEARAASRGRTTLQGAGYALAGEMGAAEQFALAHGYRVANRESLTQLLMSDYTVRRDLVMERIGDRMTDYRIVTFDTTCPEQHLRSFGRLLGMSHSEVPLGELDLTDSEWTPERLRAAEQRCVDIGRHVLTGLAIAPDGSVAGSSDVRINDADPSLGQVGLTLVDPAHRGHRLGLALEIATHDLAMAACPACVSFDTWNADANTHMNSVNESLGYRSIEILVELQKVL